MEVPLPNRTAISSKLMVVRGLLCVPVPIALNFLQLNVGVDGVVEPEGVGGGGEIKIYAFFSICFYILQVLSQRRDGAPAARPGTDGAPAARPGTDGAPAACPGTDQCIIKIKNVKKKQHTL